MATPGKNATPTPNSQSNGRFVDMPSNEAISLADDPSKAYLGELLAVLDEVQQKGEPYLERLIVEAGLEDHENSLCLNKDSAKREANAYSQNLYGTANEVGLDAAECDEASEDTASESTASLVDRIAARIAQGKTPIFMQQTEDLVSYGARIAPYGSFGESETDLGLLKKSRLAIHEAVSKDDLNNSPIQTEKVCRPRIAQGPKLLQGRWSENLYDERPGHPDHSHGPAMELASSSDDDDEEVVPGQYHQYSAEESQCMSIVANFRSQFTDAYPERRPLYLTPVNEVGVPRFLCTTIRPTIVPYGKLFFWDGIARFVAYQMEYLLLNPPDQPPNVILSPAKVLREKQGNSFDYSILLASLLIGVGYDAYVVYGYAVAEICIGDESNRLNPFVPLKPDPDVIPSYEKQFDLSEMHSSIAHDIFRTSIERQRAERIAERNKSVPGLEALLEEEKKRSKKGDAECDTVKHVRKEVDPFEGRRVHAWVAVIPGQREVTEPFFIEPLTGLGFRTDHPEFLGVEAVWNHRQYYVNMAGETPNWDLSDTQSWELVFVQKEKLPVTIGEEGRPNSPDGLDDIRKRHEMDGLKHPYANFEMPRPWSLPLRFSRKRYLRFAKSGYRLHRFKQSDLEVYHDHERPDGLVQKIVVYETPKKSRVKYVKECFKHRKDQLLFRKHLVHECTIREYFAPGHHKSLRIHEIRIEGKDRPTFTELYKALNTLRVSSGTTRIIEYFGEYRNDRLDRLEQRCDEMVWYHSQRSDHLVKREVRFGLETDRSYAVEALKCKGDQRPIIYIAEKYDRDPTIADSDQDIYIREYDVRSNKLTLVYQAPDGLLTSTQRRFTLPDFSEAPQSGFELPPSYGQMSEDVVNVIFRDQLQEEQRLPIELWDEMVEHYNKALHGITQARRAEAEFKEEIQMRNAEGQHLFARFTPYDVEKNPRTKEILEKDKQENDSNAKAKRTAMDFDPSTFDWFAPYFAAYGTQEIQSKEDALAIRQAILDDIKERLLYTANALQKTHEDLFHELQGLNENFRKAQISGDLTPEDYKTYEKDKHAMQFKMHMLERRQEHLQFDGPQKLKKINSIILADPRFSTWLSGMNLYLKEHVYTDELIAVKGDTPNWTPEQRKKVWKHESEDGEVVVQPLKKNNRGDFKR